MRRKMGGLFCVLIVTLLLQACGKDEYVSDTHKRDDIITRPFDMISCEKDYGTVCVETTEEAVAREVVKNIDSALKNIELKPEENEKQTIYVLNQVPELPLSAVGEPIIFAEQEKVLSGDVADVTQELIYRDYGCNYWISYGLSHLRDEVDTKKLCQYYGNEENWYQLQLYGTHFFETFQDAEQCRMEKNTAVSIMQEICGSKNKITKGLAEEIKNKREEYVNAWLTSMGIQGEFIADSELTEDNLIFYSLEDEFCHLTLVNLVVQIEGNPYSEACVRDIAELDAYLSYTQQDILDLNMFVKSNEILGGQVDWDKKWVCKKCESEQVISYTNYITKDVELITWDSLVHEVVHLYTSGYELWEYTGLADGLAEYLGTVKFNECRKRMAYEYYTDAEEYFQKEKAAYEAVKPIDVNNFDMELYEHLWAKSIYNGEKDGRGQRMIDVYPDGVGRIEEFADMTYVECEDYVAYIVNNYGFGEALKLLATNITNREENEKLIRQYLDEWRITMI